MRVKEMRKGVLKKGQISPSVLIALIVIVLVLIVGVIVYVVVSDKGEDKTTTLPSGVEVASKASPLAELCKSACDTGSKIGFCDVERKITDALSASCKELSTNSQYSSYNVQTCPSIDCTTTTTAQQADTTCTGLSGKWESPTSDGKCPVQDGKSVRKRTPSDQPPTSGQICCYYY